MGPRSPNRKLFLRIHRIRGQSVMLDSDLADLYQVTTGDLNLAVKRNHARFPADFTFPITEDECNSLLLQSARAKKGRGGRRTLPYAFNGLGVAMLASCGQGSSAVSLTEGKALFRNVEGPLQFRFYDKSMGCKFRVPFITELKLCHF